MKIERCLFYACQFYRPAVIVSNGKFILQMLGSPLFHSLHHTCCRLGLDHFSLRYFSFLRSKLGSTQLPLLYSIYLLIRFLSFFISSYSSLFVLLLLALSQLVSSNIYINKYIYIYIYRDSFGLLLIVDTAHLFSDSLLEVKPYWGHLPILSCSRWILHSMVDIKCHSIVTELHLQLQLCFLSLKEWVWIALISTRPDCIESIMGDSKIKD